MSWADAPAGALIRLAVRLLPAEQADWGQAMQAELATLDGGADRLGFALGCLRAGLLQVSPLRAAGYLLAEFLVLALTVVEGLHGALLIEVAGLVLLVPALLWWTVRGTGPLGVVGPHPWARSTRRGGYTLLAACALSWAAFLAADVEQPSHIEVSDLLRPDGAGVPVVAQALLVAILIVYTLILLWTTSTRSRIDGRIAATIGVLGIGSGVVLAALLPAGQALAVPGGWPAIGYGLTLGLLLLGVPVLAGALSTSWSAAGHGFDLGSSVGGQTAAVAALVQCTVGVTIIRADPAVVDSHLIDKGIDWLAPGMIEIALGRLVLLVLAPMIGLALGWAGAGLVRQAAAVTGRADGRRLPLAWTGTSVATLYGALILVVLVALSHPIAQVFAGKNRSVFGPVGTTSVAFGPGQRQLLTENPEQVSQLWDMSDPQRPAKLATFQGAAMFTPDRRTLVTAGAVWQVSDPAPTAQPTKPVRVGRFDGGEPQTFSPDGQFLVSSTVVKGQGMILWNLADPAHPRLIGGLPNAEWAIVTPDDRTLITSNDTSCTFWQVAADRSRLTRGLTMPNGGEPSISPDGRFLTTHDGDVLTMREILWRLVPGGEPQKVATIPLDQYDSLPFSPDGRWLVKTNSDADADPDGSVVLRSVADPTQKLTLPPADPALAVYQIGFSSTLTTVAFAPDGHSLAVVWGNSLVARWSLDGPGGKPVQTAVVRRQTRGAGVVTFSPDLSTVAGSATDGSNSVSLWRLG